MAATISIWSTISPSVPQQGVHLLRRLRPPNPRKLWRPLHLQPPFSPPPPPFSTPPPPSMASRSISLQRSSLNPKLSYELCNFSRRRSTENCISILFKFHFQCQYSFYIYISKKP
ncbi:protein farnesyltransferase subunit beta [Iris pallida]|uniref:Protein farnesyltransferase subunit beta n=1 Tax=Iris pallida TaxID=29817 RepID=A0AAX6GAV4_IRIPA|nr:protein farnesyltransferase subunit beta [Iris pallida]